MAISSYGVIYLTTNLLNNNTYVGQHISKRKDASTYIGSGIVIQQAIKKYGKKSFDKKILFEAHSIEELNLAERFFILKLKPTYNISSGGTGRQYKCWSDDRKSSFKEKMSGENAPNFGGKLVTEEVRQRQSLAKLGKKPSDITKEKMRISHNKESTLEKNRQTHLGRKHSEETKKKMSLSRKGKSLSSKGKPWSEARRKAHEEGKAQK